MVWLVLLVMMSAGWVAGSWSTQRSYEKRIDALEETIDERDEQIAALKKQYSDMLAFLAAVDEEAERQARRRGGRWTRDRL